MVHFPHVKGGLYSSNEARSKLFFSLDFFNVNKIQWYSKATFKCAIVTVIVLKMNNKMFLQLTVVGNIQTWLKQNLSAYGPHSPTWSIKEQLVLAVRNEKFWIILLILLFRSNQQTQEKSNQYEILFQRLKCNPLSVKLNWNVFKNDHYEMRCHMSKSVWENYWQQTTLTLRNSITSQFIRWMTFSYRLEHFEAIFV